MLATPGEATLAFKVEGMDCEACTAPIKTEVEKLSGVRSASIDFSKKRLSVREMPRGADPKAILAAVRRAGFKASPIGENGL